MWCLREPADREGCMRKLLAGGPCIKQLAGCAGADSLFELEVFDVFDFFSGSRENFGVLCVDFSLKWTSRSTSKALGSRPRSRGMSGRASAHLTAWPSPSRLRTSSEAVDSMSPSDLLRASSNAPLINSAAKERQSLGSRVSRVYASMGTAAQRSQKSLGPKVGRARMRLDRLDMLTCRPVSA